ncbi:MAG TPA: glycosyltransferase [Bacteroidetes bacterium]|nr:glycosyltransferase [Bacteroidota bacterium]
MTGEKTKISIIVPFLNERESLKELYEGLLGAATKLSGDYEMMFIDDGSTDGSAMVIEEIHGRDNRVKLIQFRRNYGKSAALAAGFAEVSGDYVVTIDADLQDDPDEIPNLIAKLEEGYDLVSGWKKTRRDPFLKRNTSKIYNFFTSFFSGIRLHDFNCGLKAYRKDVIDSIHIYGELHRYLPVLAHHNGFRVTEIPVKHHERKYGQSKFGVARFARGAFDLITVTFLTRYTKRPLHLFGLLGLFSFLLGSIISLVLAYQRIFFKIYLSNRPLLFLGVLLIIVGVQFISLGLLGEMITAQRQDTQSFQIKQTLGLKE